jgi:hypothetical protein
LRCALAILAWCCSTIQSHSLDYAGAHPRYAIQQAYVLVQQRQKKRFTKRYGLGQAKQ